MLKVSECCLRVTPESYESLPTIETLETIEECRRAKHKNKTGHYRELKCGAVRREGGEEELKGQSLSSLRGQWKANVVH